MTYSYSSRLSDTSSPPSHPTRGWLWPRPWAGQTRGTWLLSEVTTVNIVALVGDQNSNYVTQFDYGVSLKNVVTNYENPLHIYIYSKISSDIPQWEMNIKFVQNYELRITARSFFFENFMSSTHSNFDRLDVLNNVSK